MALLDEAKHTIQYQPPPTSREDANTTGSYEPTVDQESLGPPVQ